MEERFAIGPMGKDPATVSNIQRINDRLAALGIRLALEPGDDAGYVLTLQIRKNARNAGKHRISFLDQGINCSPDQIREMIKEEGADAAANYLGCSRATLFRRLKESETDPTAFY